MNFSKSSAHYAASEHLINSPLYTNVHMNRPNARAGLAVVPSTSSAFPHRWQETQAVIPLCDKTFQPAPILADRLNMPLRLSVQEQNDVPQQLTCNKRSTNHGFMTIPSPAVWHRSLSAVANRSATLPEYQACQRPYPQRRISASPECQCA